MTRSDWEAATPKCPGVPANIGRQTCGRGLDWTTAPVTRDGIDDEDGVWCCAQHGPMLTGREAAGRAGWAPMRFADEAA